MFYAHFVLAKKGPLARIWLAAHWDKKLTKAHVFETNIEKSVDGILQPKVKMALRTSGHLLLGVVRIYSRKAKYLLADCNEAFVKIKMAFRPGMVDLPEEHREAAVNAITLPEVFHDFDTTMPELNDVDIEAQFSLNQSRAEEITMREDYGSISLVNHDDGFGDMGFDTDAPDLMRHASGLEPSMEQSNLLFSEPALEPVGLEKEQEPVPSTSTAQPQEAAMEIDTGVRDIISGGLFEGGLFDEAPMGEVPPVDASIPEPTPQDIPPPPESDDEDMDRFGGPPSIASSDGSRPPSVMRAVVAPTPTAPTPVPPQILEPSVVEPPPPSQEPQVPAETPAADRTTLIQNEEESFALAPVDASALKGLTKTRKKRKLIVDEVKNISGEEMKNQLSDTSDIVTTLDLAPPTKRLMHWKETGGVEKLFALPARSIPARVLFKNYQRHLTLRAIGTEDFAMLGDADSLQLEQAREARDHDEIPPPELPTPARRGRKRKVVEESRTPLHPPPEEPILPLPQVEEAPPPTPFAPAMMLQPQTPTPVPLQPPLTPAMQEEIPPQEMFMAQPPTPQVGLMPAVSQMGLMPPTPSMLPPGTPGMMYPQTPGYPAPPTPLPHIEEMPHLPPDQVSSILQEQEALGVGVGAPPMTPAHPAPEELLAGPSGILSAPTPRPGLVGELPLEPLEHLQSELPAMENMGYDQTQMANMGYEDQMGRHTPTAMSERAQSPWAGDYDYEPGPAEEQQVDETDEQFEERVLNKRAYQMFTVVRQKLQHTDRIYLADMCYRNTKKQVAQKFYSCLVLKKFSVLELEQDEAYGPISVLKGPKFNNPVM